MQPRGQGGLSAEADSAEVCGWRRATDSDEGAALTGRPASVLLFRVTPPPSPAAAASVRPLLGSPIPSISPNHPLLS